MLACAVFAFASHFEASAFHVSSCFLRSSMYSSRLVMGLTPYSGTCWTRKPGATFVGSGSLADILTIQAFAERYRGPCGAGGTKDRRGASYWNLSAAGEISTPNCSHQMTTLW